MINHNVITLDTIFSYLPGNAYCKNREGVYLWCNHSQVEALNCNSINDVIGKTDFDLQQLSTAIKIRENDMRVMEQGVPELIEEPQINNDQAVVISHKAPLKNSAGEIIGIIGNSISINSQKTDIGRANSLLENIVTNLPAHIYWKNRKGIYLGCNNKQAQSLGFEKASDIVGKTDFELCEKSEIAETLRENDIRIMRSSEPEIIEESVEFEGEKHTFITHKSPLMDSKLSEAIGILGVSIDITKQKILEQSLKLRTQELAKALEARETFIRNVSHEIRTPLQSIIAIPESLQVNYDILSDDVRKACVNEIVDASMRLMNLVSNILDLSKLREGTFVLNFEEHNIKQMVEEVLQEFKYSYGNIDYTLGSNVPNTMKCDKVRVAQVLRNLIGNSIKHGGLNKPLSLTITNFEDVDKLPYIKFSLKDEGVGIPKGEEEAIFDAFVESAHTRRLAGGTGLGLSVVKEIVDSHKGRIWVDSLGPREIGTRMSFTLPA